MLKKLITLIIFALASSIGLVACTPTPPSIILQRSFSSTVDIFPEGTPVQIETVKILDDRFMFRCFIKTEQIDDFCPSEYDIGNVYFIASEGALSTNPFVIKGKYSVCCDDPSEDNPEFAQFLKDEKDGEVLNELAEKMVELAVGKKSGKTESYVFGEIQSNYVSGIYYYGDFNLENMTMKFIRINITEEMLKEYKENGTVSSHGISVEDFDPYRYSEYVDEIIRNAL